MPEGMDFSMGKISPNPGSLNKLKAESIAASKDSKWPHLSKSIQICLKDVIDYINTQELDPFVKKELVKTASGYPDLALMKFVESMPNQISRIRSKTRKKARNE